MALNLFKSLKMTFFVTFFFCMTLLLSTGCQDKTTDLPFTFTPKNIPISLQGEWESSGGDIVECEEKNYILDYWEYYVAPNNHTPKNITDTPPPATLKEFFERRYYEAHEFELDKSLESKSASKTLDEVLLRIWTASPLFGDQVYEAYKQSKFSTWKPSNKLINIDDSTPRFEIPGTCALTQLVNRYSVDNAEKVPELEYHYNPILFDPLPEVQKAMMVLHEVFYLIAKKDTHTNSNHIRKLVAFAFSKEFTLYSGKLKNIDTDQKSSRNLNPLNVKQNLFLVFKQILSYPFGDYVKFFIRENNFLKSENPYYDSLISLMKKLRYAKSQCIKSGKTPNECLHFVHNSRAIQYSLSPSESLVYAARFIFDMGFSGQDFSSEYLSSINKALLKKSSFDKRTYLKKLCFFINSKDRKDHLILGESAKQQCRLEDIEVTLIKERPSWTEFNCHSSDDTVRIIYKEPKTETAQTRVRLISEHINGTPIFPAYTGNFNIQNLKERKITRDFIFDSKEFDGSLDVVLNLTGVEDPEQKNLIYHFLKKSNLDLGITLENKKISRLKARKLLENQSPIQISVPMDKCTIREAKAQPSLFFY